MVPHLKLSIEAAVLVAAAGGACAWIWPPPPAALAQSPLTVIEHCKRAAELLYDVHWAAACFKHDGDNDCMLPDEQAARVNAILGSEEARCMASEAQARSAH